MDSGLNSPVNLVTPGRSEWRAPSGMIPSAAMPRGIVTVISNSFPFLFQSTAIRPDGLSKEARADVNDPGFGAIYTRRQPTPPGCCRIPATYA